MTRFDERTDMFGHTNTAPEELQLTVVTPVFRGERESAGVFVEGLPIGVTEVTRLFAVLEIGANDPTPECVELRLRRHITDNERGGCKGLLYIRPLASSSTFLWSLCGKAHSNERRDSVP
jgi:hypothetical protein